MNDIQFIQQIVKENSWVNDIYLQHISENNGLYTYSFMDRVSSAFVDIATNALVSKINAEENLIKIKTFLNTIESGLQTNSDEIICLILVGFIENITPELKVFSSIREMMKDATREVLEANLNPDANIPSIGSAAGWAVSVNQTDGQNK